MAKAKEAKSQLAEDGENTALWNRCSTTPSAYLKDFKRTGGFSGKSIDPTYRLRVLTELFGPCGKGWGFVQEDQWSDGGSGAYVVYVRGHLWYLLDGERCQTMSHTGGTVADRAPDEVYKMAETDALGKCCLDLGIGADVYMGLHDGDKYTDTREPMYKPSPRDAGRRPAGTKPSNIPAAAEPIKAIAEDEVGDILKAINDLADDVDAYQFARGLFNRMRASDGLSPNSLALIGERMLIRRCGFVTEEIFPSLKKIADVYVKQGWISNEVASKAIDLCERRLGIPPKSSGKE